MSAGFQTGVKDVATVLINISWRSVNCHFSFYCQVFSDTTTVIKTQEHLNAFLQLFWKILKAIPWGLHMSRLLEFAAHFHSLWKQLKWKPTCFMYTNPINDILWLLTCCDTGLRSHLTFALETRVRDPLWSSNRVVMLKSPTAGWQV